MSECNEERFLKDVAGHKMQILQDAGVYRHVRFKQPDTSAMYFDLITWPGYLCYTGDMGTYVVTRIHDMFEFFCKDKENCEHIKINPGYWSEKVEGVDRWSPIKEFSHQKFSRVVMQDLVYWIRNNAHQTTKEERRELWDRVVDEIINAEGQQRQEIAVYEFNHCVNKEVGYFSFDDFFEHSVDEYSLRFLWCCYAIAWGIQKYYTGKKDSANE